ncbi:MAG TPA: DUF5916 domain-containing protein [Terriglobales bacterium]|nr:DUF5916 domain-containing protein [Terriglobales bacterium]
MKTSEAPASLTISKDIVIPRVDHAPVLEDFIDMKPAPAWEGKLAKVDGFIQNAPKDGSPPTEATHVYLGYDAKNFYAIFVCFDSRPGTVRNRLARRDTINDEDDEVQIYLDTFSDKRRAYGFMINPRGVQFDYLWTEDGGYDGSFDTLWQSSGQMTDKGWIAMMSVPFKSMRFPARATQKWGVLLQRVIPRTGENLFWPPVSTSVSGRLNQEGSATGLANISPGRNLQFIPFGVMRSFRAPDLRDPGNPRYSSAMLRGDIGMDVKAVIKDSFVLDVALNPDFSQVESDEPQVTVNQRFEVFFPEKRPFFLENANFFDTPITLLFTRRIADPQIGARLTGKVGRYSVGILFADDQSPGRRVADTDPLRNKRAYFGVGRVNREFWKQSSIGLMYTHREFENSYNRVGSLDMRFKLGQRVTAMAQGVVSQSRSLAGATKRGHAADAWAEYCGRYLCGNTLFQDTSPDFETQAGFFRRPDVRRFSNFARYLFRPEGKHLLSHGPSAFQLALWDSTGRRLEKFLNVNYRFNFRRNNEIGFFTNGGHNRLRRIQDGFSALATPDQDFRTGSTGFFFYSAYFKQLSFNGEISRGTSINYVPASGKPPVLADNDSVWFSATVKPVPQLTVDNRYIMNRYRDRVTAESAFINHIIRSKWNYQFTRQLSLRTIMQYTAVLANPNHTTLATNKGFNGDVLVTWLLHPGTAVYVGYNSNLANPEPVFNGPGAPPNRFVNDGKQVFVKVSYLFRY